jgi:hypothetical protein
VEEMLMERERDEEIVPLPSKTAAGAPMVDTETRPLPLTSPPSLPPCHPHTLGTSQPSSLPTVDGEKPRLDQLPLYPLLLERCGRDLADRILPLAVAAVAGERPVLEVIDEVNKFLLGRRRRRLVRMLLLERSPKRTEPSS